MTTTKLAISVASLGCALAVGACSSGGVSPNPSGSTGSSGGLIGKTSLTIGVKSDQPGLGLLTPEGYQGYDINIAKIIAKGLGVPESNITWKTTVSVNREPFLQQGIVDLVVASYTINDARKKVVAFGGPYYIAGQDLMVQANSDIDGPDDMDGLIACSAVGSSSAARMQSDYPDVQLQLFDTYSKCVTALKGGGVDAVTTDNIVLAGYAAQPQNVGDFKLTGNLFSSEPYGIGINKSDVAGCKKVNEILVQASNDGSYDAAFTQALGASGLEPPTLDPDLLTNCGG